MMLAPPLASRSTVLASGHPTVRVESRVLEQFSRPFAAHTHPEGFMARMANPAHGFDPFKTERGTEVLFLSNPAQLGPSFGARLTPEWQNGLGLVLYRNESANVLGAIFLHGVMKTPWSVLGADSWHGLGGIMAFSQTSFDDAIPLVVDKAVAMTPKWRFIDMSLAAKGHGAFSCQGGAKAIVVHGPSVDDKRAAISLSAEVAKILGIYIAGPDQNTGPDLATGTNWSEEFAAEAPFNFVGVKTAGKGYEGMNNPSPFTARGVFNGLKVVSQELLGGYRPVFLQGYGGVGKVMVASCLENGVPVSGLSSALVSELVAARANGFRNRLFLDSSGTEAMFGAERRAAEEEAAKKERIEVTGNLVEALRQVPETVVLSPNASAHPITEEVADYILSAGIRAVVGAANNMLGLVDGSPVPIAWKLQNSGVFVPNDSRINRMGALACVVKAIGLDATGLGLQTVQIGDDVREEVVKAYRVGIPPQLYSERKAADDWNRLLAEGRALGGRFVNLSLSPPSTTTG